MCEMAFIGEYLLYNFRQFNMCFTNGFSCMAKDAGIRGDERKSIYKQSLAKENFSKVKVHLGNQMNILILKIKMIPLIE